MKGNLFAVCLVLSAYIVVPIIFYFPHATTALGGYGRGGVGGSVPVSDGPAVRRDERWPLVSSAFGEISAVKIKSGENGCYHLHFITMYPHSLFLPAYLYSEMVFYVNSGSGTLSWIDLEDSDKLRETMLQRGDIYRLQPETLFYIQNNFSDIPLPLQIYAIFSDSKEELQKPQFAGAYVGIHDLVLGFDNDVLQEALNVPMEVIEELRAGGNQPQIVEGLPEVNSSTWGVGPRVIRAIQETKNYYDLSSVKSSHRAYNIFKTKHDVENCNGWSKTVTKKQSDVLKHTNIGVFMVNLFKGAMMGPHWNPNYAEIAIALHGTGMIHVSCPTIPNETLCKDQRIKVEEGDVFVVPRYHPMSQISYNNESFVFVGFTMTSKKIQPQYLAGNSSILQLFNKMVLGKSFNVGSPIIDLVYSAQRESFIFECTSCAEEEERLMEEEEAGRGRGMGRGRGRRRHEEGREGEIARKGEEEMERREREAEEAAARGRGAGGGGGEGGRGGGSYGEESW